MAEINRGAQTSKVFPHFVRNLGGLLESTQRQKFTMKLKNFAKSFIGALIGVLIYQMFFDISDPFQNIWLNYLAEIVLLIFFVSIGLVTVHFLFNKFLLLESKENA